MSKDTDEVVPGVTAEQWERMTFGERIQSVPEYYRPVPGTSGELSFLTDRELKRDIWFFAILFAVAVAVCWYFGQTEVPSPGL